MYDLMRGTIGLVCFLLMLQIDFAVVYHYIRGQSVVKLYVVYNVLEVGVCLS
jgi:hypothetical protein